MIKNINKSEYHIKISLRNLLISLLIFTVSNIITIIPTSAESETEGNEEAVSETEGTEEIESETEGTEENETKEQEKTIKEKIEITLFKVHNDFSQSDSFKINETVVFFVLWKIPKDILFDGNAIITIEGVRTDEKKWKIIKKKKIHHDFASHHWGWDYRSKIPKYTKPESSGTATVELNLYGHEPVKEVLEFSIGKY